MRDLQSNVIQSAQRTDGKVREYEFRMPLKNPDEGDILWERDKSYMVAILVGPGQEYKGVSEDVWMSDQILIRIGNPSTLSMYVPPHLPGHNGGRKGPRGSHGH